MSISLTDPAITIAGIKQFGLAPDGSDLRDLAAAFARLQAEVKYWRDRSLQPGDMPETVGQSTPR